MEVAKPYLILVCLAGMLSVAISVAYPVPIGYDFVNFHIKVAESYARGENGMFCDLVMRSNAIPYPPLFHLLLVPSVWMGAGLLFGRILQALFLPLAILTSTWVMSKEHSNEVAMYVGLLLVSSRGYLDSVIQVIPHAINSILLPIAFYSVLRKKSWLFVVVASAMVYTHGLYSIAVLGGMVLLLLWKREWKTVGALALVTLPILIITGIWLTSGVGNWMRGFATEPERALFRIPIQFTILYIGGLAFVLPLMFYKLVYWKKQTSLEQLSLATFLSMMVMVVPVPDRFLQYASIPLAIIASLSLARFREKKYIVPIVIAVFCWFYYVQWMILLTNSYWIFPE